MSQATKCRNARRKAAKRRNWEAAQIRRTMAMQPTQVGPDPALFSPVKVDRKICSETEEGIRREILVANKAAIIGQRHLDIENHYKRKILALQPIGGIQPIFLRQNERNYEEIRLRQEIGAAQNLKRKFGTDATPLTQDEESDDVASHGSTVQPNVTPPHTVQTVTLATPPHTKDGAESVPRHGSPQQEPLPMDLQSYPVMWQGLLILKSNLANVQMHFISGDPNVARDSLPCTNDEYTPELKIAHRMRLEQAELEDVNRKMQTVNEHCVLLALPTGRDDVDVQVEALNLQSDFISYLKQKNSAGVAYIARPGCNDVAFVIHFFPSCNYTDNNLACIFPKLKYRQPYLVVVIVTV